MGIATEHDPSRFQWGTLVTRFLERDWRIIEDRPSLFNSNIKEKTSLPLENLIEPQLTPKNRLSHHKFSTLTNSDV